MDAEKLAGGRREEMAEIRVRQGRAGEPRLRRRKLRGPHERVQEREVHRLLARIDLGVQGAHGEKEEKRPPEDESRFPALRGGGHACGAAVAKEAGREEGRRRDQEKASCEGYPAPRDEEPRQKREEEDAGDAPEGVAPGPRGKQDGEETRAREPHGLEPYRKEREGDEGRAQEGDSRAPLRRRGRAGRACGMREEKVVARQGLRRRGREESGLEGTFRQPLQVLEEQNLRVIVDGERLVGELVGHLDSEDGRARGDLLYERVAEVAREEETERAVREGKLLGHARDGAVQALRLEDDPVRARELPGELFHLSGRVGLVEGERDHLVTLGRAPRKPEGKPLVPILLDDARPVRHVVVEPERGRDDAVRARVDRREGEGPHRRAAHDGGPEEASRPAALGLLREECSGEEREERVDGQEIARELHVERARQKHERHEEGDDDPLDVRELSEEREAPSGGPESREAEERPETPEHDFAGFVQEIRDADVLVRVRHGARVADHRALLG